MGQTISLQTCSAPNVPAFSCSDKYFDTNPDIAGRGVSNIYPLTLSYSPRSGKVSLSPGNSRLLRRLPRRLDHRLLLPARRPTHLPPPQIQTPNQPPSRPRHPHSMPSHRSLHSRLFRPASLYRLSFLRRHPHE